MTAKKIVAALMFLVFAGCKTSDDLPIVGLDKDGKTHVEKIDKDRFIEMSQKLVNEAQQAGLATLSRVDDSDSKWKLSRLSIGMRFEAEGGLRYIYEVGADAGVRFIFDKEMETP